MSNKRCLLTLLELEAPNMFIVSISLTSSDAWSASLCNDHGLIQLQSLLPQLVNIKLKSELRRPVSSILNFRSLSAFICLLYNLKTLLLCHEP